MFQSVFIAVIINFTGDKALTEKLWKDVAEKYSAPSRHYHTLNHLNHLYRQLQPVRQHIQHWNLLVLAIAFHDIIYNVLEKDNEEQSAEYAGEILSGILTTHELQILKDMILATKKHTVSDHEDTNYFTDADLSILGSNTPDYFNYTKAIRQEYSIYPDIIYKPGRQQVIKKFLEMDRIFKTPHFFTKYEMQARENLKHELSSLENK